MVNNYVDNVGGYSLAAAGLEGVVIYTNTFPNEVQESNIQYGAPGEIEEGYLYLKPNNNYISDEYVAPTQALMNSVKRITMLSDSDNGLNIIGHGVVNEVFPNQASITFTITKSFIKYESNSYAYPGGIVVVDTDTGLVYRTTQTVPKGTDITDTVYYQPLLKDYIDDRDNVYADWLTLHEPTNDTYTPEPITIDEIFRMEEQEDGTLTTIPCTADEYKQLMVVYNLVNPARMIIYTKDGTQTTTNPWVENFRSFYTKDVSGALVYKGSVADMDALHAITNPDNGDVYLVQSNDEGLSATYVWSDLDNSWTQLSNDVDLNNYVTQAQNQQADAATLQSAKNYTDSAISNYHAPQADWAETDSTADDFIKNKPTTLSGTVNLTGGQEIDGAKTFDDSPTVPTPTNGTDAANKNYVDNMGMHILYQAPANHTDYIGDTITLSDSFYNYQLFIINYTDVDNGSSATLMVTPQTFGTNGGFILRWYNKGNNSGDTKSYNYSAEATYGFNTAGTTLTPTSIYMGYWEGGTSGTDGVGTSWTATAHGATYTSTGKSMQGKITNVIGFGKLS